MNTRSGLIWLWLSGLVVVLDQASKWVLARNLDYLEGIAVAPFLNLVHVHNRGAAFSLLADQAGWQRGFFIAVAIAAAAIIIHLLRRPQDRRSFQVALALVLGGAVGNVIDRLLHGHVIDFLDFYAGVWHWPAFNVADAAISVGAVVLAWDALRAPPSKRPGRSDE